MSEVSATESEGKIEVVVRYSTDEHSLRWQLLGSGWLRLEFSYELDRTSPYHGVGFDLSKAELEGFHWLGLGPSRRWKNRTVGGHLDVWQKRLGEPEFAGYHDVLSWAQIDTIGGDLEVLIETPGLHLGVLTPGFPEDAKDAMAQVPETGLGFLLGIPAIGTKFYPPEDLGPQAQPHPPGRYEGAIWLRPVGEEG